jgi:hypothetical protein
VHVVLDNLSTHSTPDVQAWLDENPHVHFHSPRRLALAQPDRELVRHHHPAVDPSRHLDLGQALNMVGQGRSEDQRDLLDVESVAGHLLKPGSLFAFLAVHRRELFPDGMFTDLFPSRQGRPSVPADVMATVITLQALQGLSDSETV